VHSVVFIVAHETNNLNDLKMVDQLLPEQIHLWREEGLDDGTLMRLFQSIGNGFTIASFMTT
jgi:hypothetical protein